jgi:putative membrane-bound dehydrogenase-like protein
MKTTPIALAASLAVALATSPLRAADPPLPKAPDGFDVKIFAKPPQVNYPVAITAAPTGELYIGSDGDGSLDKAPHRGKVVRAIDTDGDGVADKFTTFAVMDHPRGVVFDHGTLWVQHPPLLTVYFDDNGDGVADRSTVLVTGTSTKLVAERGADHTTNGMRMGIDGWLYIATGDFGMVDATGTDGKKLTLHGGGIVRVRPDGSEIEVYESFNRNMCDVAIDPYMNVFTRDNTNDGGGWNSRLAYNIQSANYGYPSLFQHFSDEIMPPLADYGGGSGTGAIYLHEPGFPKPYDDALLTCDWGRGFVYHNALKPNGPTFTPDQKEFINIERPTGITVDASAHLYVASWRNGGFGYSGEDVGHIAMITPKGYKADAVPDLEKIGEAELVKLLASRSAVLRLATQRAILRRNPNEALCDGVLKLASDKKAELYVRVAAIFTYKQLLGEKSTPALAKLAADEAVREFALRAMTDRLTQLKGVPREPYIKALSDANPRVQIAALVGLGRLHDTAAAPQILRLAHLGSSGQAVAAPAKPLYESGVVRGGKPVEIKADLQGSKQLYLVVTDGGDGNSLDHAAWIEPKLITTGDPIPLTSLKWVSAVAGWMNVHVDAECQGGPLKIGGVVMKGLGTHANSLIVYNLPADVTSFEAVGAVDDGSGGEGKGSVKFMVFNATPPDIGGEHPKWPEVDHVVPHIAVETLVAVGGAEACLAALDAPDRDGALWALKKMHDPAAVDGLIKRLNSKGDVELLHGVLAALVRLYNREDDYTTGDWWGTRPDDSGPYYKRVTWSRSGKIADALIAFVATADAPTLQYIAGQVNLVHATIPGLKLDAPAAVAAVEEKPAVDLAAVTKAPAAAGSIGTMEYKAAVAAVLKIQGDAKLGEQIFTKQGCVLCHTTKEGQTPKGPHLVNIGKRYKNAELLESILKPNTKIAQGFDTNLVTLKSGGAVVGFVVKEAADSIEVRDITGKSTVVPRDQVAKRMTLPQSIMPEGLAASLTPEQLAALIAYLDSL